MIQRIKKILLLLAFMLFGLSFPLYSTFFFEHLTWLGDDARKIATFILTFTIYGFTLGFAMNFYNDLNKGRNY